jgi:hypothetical protein
MGSMRDERRGPFRRLSYGQPPVTRAKEYWQIAISHARQNAVGYLALFIAISGSAHAAVSLPANSVGTGWDRGGSKTCHG